MDSAPNSSRGHAEVALPNAASTLADRSVARDPRALLDAIDDGVVVLDHDFHFSYVNGAAARLAGASAPSEVVGRHLYEVFPEFQRSIFDLEFRRARQEQRTIVLEAHHPPHGVWHQIRIHPSGDELVVIYQDMSEKHRVDEEQHEAAREREQMLEAERAARMEAERERRRTAESDYAKSQFLAVKSHELRTPLNAIGGYVELLEMEIRGPLTEAQRTDLGRIRRSHQHLQGLINDVLNFVRLDTGQVRYEMEDVRLCEALERVEGVIAPQLRAKHIEYSFAVEPSIIVRADGEKLRQIALNLLSNATKLTNSGGRVDVWCEAEGAVARVMVRDTGRGVPAHRLEQIFEPFVFAGRGLESSDSGVGLGLSISRDLARAMGGDLTLESRLGEGATFTLSLPRAD